MQYLRVQKLSETGEALVLFDKDSIRQVVASQHRSEPEVWLADPELYERNGRVLRDSPSPRLLAYSASDHILYATDGEGPSALRASGHEGSIPDGRNQSLEPGEDLRRKR